MTSQKNISTMIGLIIIVGVAGILGLVIYLSGLSDPTKAAPPKAVQPAVAGRYEAGTIVRLNKGESATFLSDDGDRFDVTFIESYQSNSFDQCDIAHGNFDSTFKVKVTDKDNQIYYNQESLTLRPCGIGWPVEIIKNNKTEQIVFTVPESQVDKWWRP